MNWELQVLEVEKILFTGKASILVELRFLENIDFNKNLIFSI